MSNNTLRSGISSETIEKEKLERYYTYAGKGVCAECEQYCELFVYRAKNTLLFEGEKNIFYDLRNKEFSNRLVKAFAVAGYPLNRVLNSIRGGEAKARIEELDYNTFTIKNPVATPGAISYEMFSLKSNFKTVKIYKREELGLCGNCISTTIQTHLDHSVKWGAKVQ